MEAKERRVEIVCDGCGDASKTEEYVTKIAKAFGVTPLVVHEQLWDGNEINGVPVNISGAHVRRVGDATAVDG